MRNTLKVAYGRVSASGQEKEHLAQLSKIKSKFKLKSHVFGLDTVSGDSNPFDRPYFKTLLEYARPRGLPFHLEHPDRFLKTFNNSLIHDVLLELSEQKITLQYAFTNGKYSKIIARILQSDISDARKLRKLIVLIEKQIKWRQKNIKTLQATPIRKQDIKYKSLTKSPHFYVLEKCAGHILSRQMDANNPDLLNFFVDSYLGKAFNLKQHHYLAVGKRLSIPRGQRSYLDRPEHIKLFRTIHSLEHTELFKGDGSPKQPSNQFISDRLNHLGFRNIQGNAFNRKSVHRIRASEAYRILTAASPLPGSSV